jgi:hypothetical protein
MKGIKQERYRMWMRERWAKKAKAAAESRNKKKEERK